MLSDLKVETDIITIIAVSQAGRTIVMHVETFKMDVLILSVFNVIM